MTRCSLRTCQTNRHLAAQIISLSGPLSVCWYTYTSNLPEKSRCGLHYDGQVHGNRWGRCLYFVAKSGCGLYSIALIPRKIQHFSSRPLSCRIQGHVTSSANSKHTKSRQPFNFGHVRHRPKTGDVLLVLLRADNTSLMNC